MSLSDERSKQRSARACGHRTINYYIGQLIPMIVLGVPMVFQVRRVRDVMLPRPLHGRFLLRPARNLSSTTQPTKREIMGQSQSSSTQTTKGVNDIPPPQFDANANAPPPKQHDRVMDFIRVSRRPSHHAVLGDDVQECVLTDFRKHRQPSESHGV